MNPIFLMENSKSIHCLNSFLKSSESCNIFILFMYQQMWNEKHAAPTFLCWWQLFTFLVVWLYERNFPYEGGHSIAYTKRHFKVWIWKHLGILHLTEKQVKIDNNKLTTIQEHLSCFNYSPSFEDFKLKTMESLLIACVKPILNKADSSLSLELF